MNEIPLPILLQGVHGSPYTRKALAALRYRRLPYRFIIGSPGTPITAGCPDWKSLPVPKISLLPTFYFPDEHGSLEAVTDSTPILRRLESVSTERSIIPSDPVVAFLNYVLEDYCDEWLTRCMFHFRWSYEDDIQKSGDVLPFLRQTDLSPTAAAEAKEAFVQRQVGRLYVVGSNETTAPVIEDSYVRFLQLMDAHLQQHQFLLGGRPGSADFAVAGQLTCLAHFDPTPMRLTLDTSLRTFAWVERVEDLCGFEVTEEDWFTRMTVPETIHALLREVARTHMPQLIANAKAVAVGEKRFETEIDGQTWAQPSFPYQAKCLRWTREEFAALSGVDQERVRVILESVGLLPLVDKPIEA